MSRNFSSGKIFEKKEMKHTSTLETIDDEESAQACVLCRKSVDVRKELACSSSSSFCFLRMSDALDTHRPKTAKSALAHISYLV
jgi:hypothetical protein